MENTTILTFPIPYYLLLLLPMRVVLLLLRLLVLYALSLLLSVCPHLAAGEGQHPYNNTNLSAYISIDTEHQFYSNNMAINQYRQEGGGFCSEEQRHIIIYYYVSSESAEEGYFFWGVLPYSIWGPMIIQGFPPHGPCVVFLRFLLLFFSQQQEISQQRRLRRLSSSESSVKKL